MHRVFSRLNSFIILNLFIVVLLIFISILISHSVGLIKHAEFLHKQSGTIININDVGYSWGKKFSSFKVRFSNISIKKIHEYNSEKIISDVVLTLNLKSLYKNLKHSVTNQSLNADDYPVVYLNVKGISVEKISDFLLKHKPQNSYYYIKKRDQEIILNNLIIFLNKYHFDNFKIELHFDDLDFQKIFKNYATANFVNNNIGIQKITFFSAVNSKDYIGQIRIKYSLNNRDGTISGLVLRQPIKSQNTISEMIYGIRQSDYTNLVVKLYGYIDQFITYGNEKINLISSDDFADFLISYNISHKDTLFEGKINSLKIQLHNLGDKKISMENVNIEARYNSKLKTLRVKKFDLDLLENKKAINFSGNLSISPDNYLELSLKTNNKFNGRKIFNYWPIHKGQKVKNILLDIVKHAFVESAELKIKTLLNQKVSNNLSSLEVNLKISDALLHKKIYDKNYALKADLGNLNIGLHALKITSDQIVINDILHANDVDILIPFYKSDSPTHSDIKFKINTSAKILENLYEEIFKETQGYQGKVIDGKISLDVKSTIATNKKFNLNDIVFIMNAKIQNLFLKNQKKTYNINSNDLKLHLSNGELKATGELEYNKIKIKKLNLLSHILDKSDGRIKDYQYSINFILPLEQKSLVELLKRQNFMIDLKGYVIGTFSNFKNSKTIKLDLNNTDISIPTLGINKSKHHHGNLNFALTESINSQELNISGIKLTIPEVSMSGEMILDTQNYNLKNTKLSFEKFFNNVFDLEYSYPEKSKNQHIYKINGSTIEVLDLQKIIKNMQKNLKKDYKTDSVHNFDVVAETVRVDSKDLLKDLKIRFIVQNNEMKKVDGAAYTSGKKGYVRIFFDSPVFAFVLHNTGQLSSDLFNSKSLQKGNLSVYANLNDSILKGDLYFKNFKVLQSPLVTTILRIFAFSGSNILQILTNGIDFSNMHCDISFTKQMMYLKQCQAFSDVLLLGADAEVNFTNNSGLVEGMIIPSSLINLPIILLQRIFTDRKTNLLDSVEGRKNFSINWDNSQKAIIKTNPISFVLPGIFSYFLSQKKTINQDNIKEVN